MIFYELIYNSYDKATTWIANYDVKAFNVVEFWESGNLSNLDLTKLSLALEYNEPVDYLPNPISLPIVNERLKNHIEAHAAHNITFFNQGFRPVALIKIQA